jgi:hypothetical protein
VAFSPDGRRLAAADAVRPLVKIWEVADDGPDSRERNVLAWHALEAEGFEARGQWRSALFHLDRLCAAEPGDGELARRRAEAAAQLQVRDKPAAPQPEVPLKK